MLLKAQSFPLSLIKSDKSQLFAFLEKYVFFVEKIRVSTDLLPGLFSR